MAPEELTKNVLETIINSFKEAALVINKDGTVLFANETFAKRVEKNIEDIIDKSFYNLFPPDIAQRRRSHVEHVINTKEAASFEDERGGRYYISYMTPMLDLYGDIDKVLIIAHDITDKKRLEKELINTKEQLESILNSIDEKVYITDLDTHEIIFANAYMKNIFGSDIEGKKCYEVFHRSNMPCSSSCKDKILIDSKEKIQRTEKYNPIIKRDYAVTNRIIKWTDGRNVKFSVAVDITDKKIAELKLKESEERYRGILENLTEGFFRTTPDGSYLMVNPAMAKLYGYSSPEELISDTKDIEIQRFVNKEERQYFVEQLEKNGYIKNFEALRVKKDGSTFWAHVNAKAVKDHEGKSLYYEGTVIDVTERKLLEKELLREKEKLSTLTYHAPFGMALIDADGKYLYVNPTFIKLFGYDLTDIPDRDTWFKKAYPDEEYRNWAHALWHQELESFKTGKTTSGTLTVTCKDGTKKIVNITPVILPTGQFIMAFIDVTEKEMFETNYRSLFENAPVGIAQTTLDGKIIIANQAFTKIFHYDSLEELKKHVTNITQLYANPKEREKLLEIIKSGKNVKGYEAQGIGKDGEVAWGSVSISAIRDEKGNIMYLQAIVEDITDRKKREQEIERLQEQYSHAQKMEALGTLTGGIAHDFNNFLTAVTGYATILKMKLGNKLDLYRYLDQIMSVSEKMADLVKSLLAFSRKQPITLEPIDLNMEVEQTKKLLKRLLTENIKIELFTSKKNPVIMADKTQLNQILFNLTTNARDAMPDGGTFTIKISTAVLYEDFIKTHGFGNQGQYAVISVSDTGIGMDKEIMSKIFDPFFTTKEHGKGTGLGLASVYGIVKQHNGYITVDSSPGKGATFNIYFPLVDMTAKKDIKEHVTIGKGTGRILIGEDDENVREYLKEVLTECGYRVFEAEDGEKLVKVFKEQDKIDLIITDVVMPNKGGIDAYNEIKAIKEDTKFIFISGYDKDAYYNIPRQDKAVRFLLKPVSTDTLIQTIDEVLKI